MEASSQVSRGRGKNKRAWTPMEDQCLIDSLKVLTEDGVFKAENGFKDGYLNELEKLMEKKIPSCGLKAHPHISSRVKTLKSKCNAIIEMVNNKSGFNWDDTKKMIVCEKSAYEDWVKGHKDAKGLYNTPFPYFEDLEMIFCKDRANGKRGECVEESISAMEEREKAIASDDQGQDNEEDDEISVSNYSRSSSATSSKRRKLKSKELDPMVASFNNVANILGELAAQMVPQFANIASALQLEKELSEKSKNVVPELLKLTGVPFEDATRAAEIIMSEQHKVDIFFALPEEKYVLSILD